MSNRPDFVTKIDEISTIDVDSTSIRLLISHWGSITSQSSNSSNSLCTDGGEVENEDFIELLKIFDNLLPEAFFVNTYPQWFFYQCRWPHQWTFQRRKKSSDKKFVLKLHNPKALCSLSHQWMWHVWIHRSAFPWAMRLNPWWNTQDTAAACAHAFDGAYDNDVKCGMFTHCLFLWSPTSKIWRMFKCWHCRHNRTLPGLLRTNFKVTSGKLSV